MAARRMMNVVERRIAVTSHYGLHVKPSEIVARFVRRSGSEVTVETCCGKRADAGDMNSLLTLGAKYGDVLMFVATGRDADDVLQRIEETI